MRELKLNSARLFALLGVAAAAVAFFFLSFESSYLALTDAHGWARGPHNELRSLRKYLTTVRRWSCSTTTTSNGNCSGSPSHRRYSNPRPSGLLVRQAVDVRPAAGLQLGRCSDVELVRLRDHDPHRRPERAAAQFPSGRDLAVVRGLEARRADRAVYVLPESGHPGAILDCSRPADRRISREHGFAMVRAVPTYVGVPPLQPGGTVTIFLHLAPGTWNLSLPFVSSQAITATAPGLHVWLPPNLDRPGSIWPVGTVHSTGAPIPLTITMAGPGVLSSPAAVHAVLHTRGARGGPGRARAQGATERRLRPLCGLVSADITASLIPAAEAEDREQERREEDLDADDDQRRRQHREALFGERPEAAIDPVDDDDPPEHDARDAMTLPPSSRPCSSLNRARIRSNQRSGLAHEVSAVGVSADPERDDLSADDRQQRAGDQGVDVPLAPEHAQAGDHDQLDQRTRARPSARPAG